MRALLLLFLLPLAAAAQTGNLVGRVVDDFGNPLPGVSVLVEGTQLGVATDIDGSYLIAGIPAGSYTATALFVEDTARADVRIQLDRTTQLNFFLPTNLYQSLDRCEPDSSYRVEDLSWQNWYLPRVHSFAEDHGLALMHEQSSGPREARLWLSLDGWEQVLLVRILWNEGGAEGTLIVGEPLLMWEGEDRVESTDRLQSFRDLWAHRCGPIQRGSYTETCTLTLAKEPDWEAVAHALEAAELWSLPDESALPDLYGHCGGGVKLVTGRGFTAEVFDGTGFRAYSYDAPFHTSQEDSLWPEKRNAARIFETARDLVRLIPPQH